MDTTDFDSLSLLDALPISASFSVLSRTQLKLTVPSSATSGTISVTTAGGAATSAASLAVLPQVTGFSPSSAQAGTSETASGNAFGGATSVHINDAITHKYS